jgi:predicted Zn-dependent peptidase
VDLNVGIWAVSSILPKQVLEKWDMKKTLWLAVSLLAVPHLIAQNVQVQEFVLGNGMKLLMVPRKGDPNVAAGWVAKVGSVNEAPGITGISHLFEHMMFKGTHVIGTNNISLFRRWTLPKQKFGRKSRS